MFNMKQFGAQAMYSLAKTMESLFGPAQVQQKIPRTTRSFKAIDVIRHHKGLGAVQERIMVGRDRLWYTTTSKYKPHHGAQESARRRRQMGLA